MVILDTAGRLHVDETMMEELANIQKAIKVDQTIFVVDAMTGQDAVNVAKSFNEQIELDGVILTKMDGDTRRRCGIIHPSSDRQADSVCWYG